jgi:hypothetical protein
MTMDTKGEIETERAEAKLVKGTVLYRATAEPVALAGSPAPSPVVKPAD